jgi:hypothetical protein
MQCAKKIYHQKLIMFSSFLNLITSFNLWMNFNSRMTLYYDFQLPDSEF